MKVLLLNQYFTSEKPEKIYAVVPINLLYLGSYLKQNGVDVKIEELGMKAGEEPHQECGRWRCGKSDKEIMDIIRVEAPQIIGLGCMYSRHYSDVRDIAWLIRKINPAIKIVIGGNHATTFADYLVNEEIYDHIVSGEGELSFLRIAQKQTDKKIVHTNLMANIDQFKPDYSLLDVGIYSDISKTTPYLMRYPAFGIISSRGCPYNCIYCTVKKVWGNTWRGRSPKAVVDEIEELYLSYGIKEFHFLDDNMAVDKKRLIEICHEIMRRGLDIRWTTPNGIPHWLLDYEVLRLMKKSGCYRLTFGIESANNMTRKFIRKQHSLMQAKEMIRVANSMGMWTVATNIIGFPYETQTEMEDTLQWNLESGIDFATFYILAPHIASDVYPYFKQENLLDFSSVFKNNLIDEVEYEKMNSILDDGGHNTLHLTADELKATQGRFYREFIKNRARHPNLLSKVRSIEDLKYTLRIVWQGFKIILRAKKSKTTKGMLYEE